MKFFRTYGVLVALTLLGGCGVLSSGYDLKALRQAQPVGTAFTTALAVEYRSLAIYEADEMFDWIDTSYYARKGLRAAGGETVSPQEIAERDLPALNVDKLTAARADLIGALSSGARGKAPVPAARAQAMFDCWMEQQEENFQIKHIARCRDGFYAAIKEVKAALAPKTVAAPSPTPAPVPAPTAPRRFVVFFSFDSARVTDGGKAVIQHAVDAADGLVLLEFAVTGHADRAGDERYNLDLSLQRAEAVRALLLDHGVAADRISIGGRGEAENAVPTADDVRERANRRVEIILLR